MRTLLVLFFTILLGISVIAQTDQLSDEAVFKLLQEQLLDTEEVPSSIDQVCLLRPNEFESLTVIGVKSENADCEFRYVIHDHKILTPEQAAAQILPQQGWAKDAPYPDWVRDWTLQVLLAFEDVALTEPEDWHKKPGAPAFLEPTVEKVAEWFVVKVWLEGQIGRTPMVPYTQVEFRYNSNGTEISREDVQHHRVSIWPPKKK